jgi:TPR repeat protein
LAAYRRASEHGHGDAAGRLEALRGEDSEQLSRDEDAGSMPDPLAPERRTTRVSERILNSWEDNAEPAGTDEIDGDGDDGTAAFNLGGQLAEQGDLSGAEEAFRRAAERGHTTAASNLGVLLERRGDLSGAEEAYRRADEGGDSNAAFNLGGLFAERGDLEAAEDAFRRADERGDANAAFNLGVLLQQRNDGEGAEAAYRRAAERAPDELGETVRDALHDLHAAMHSHNGGDS